jgi:hypothetical protein
MFLKIAHRHTGHFVEAAKKAKLMTHKLMYTPMDTSSEVDCEF